MEKRSFLDVLGFSFSKKNTPQDNLGKSKNVVAFVPPNPDDGAVYIDSNAGFFGQVINFDGIFRNERDIIYKYRELAATSEIDSAIEDIVNEAIVIDDTQEPVQINLEKTDLKDSTQEKIQKEFKEILKLLNFRNKGTQIFRNWYIDGKIHFHAMTNKEKNGIMELRYIDSANISKVKEVIWKEEQGPSGNKIKLADSIEEYYLYRPPNTPLFQTGPTPNNDSLENAIRISPDAIISAHSGLYSLERKMTYGYLHKAIKPFNQLRMIEDAVVVYRVTRAPERRVFYIDVGSLPKNKAEQYLRDIMNKYRNKMVYDPATGELQNDRRFQSMLEDFWLPRREGGKGTEITTLQGGENLGQLDDVNYFLKKLYRSLHIPISRLESGEGFNIGRSSEITRDELKFSKFIDRLRTQFSQILLEALCLQLQLKKIATRAEFEQFKNDIEFVYATDSYFTELKEAEITSSRMDTLSTIKEHIGSYYSIDWVKKNILRMTEQEIEKMDKEIQKERESNLYNKSAEDLFT